MVWDTGLRDTAQRWANQLASTCRFEHSTSGYGENLGAGYRSWADAIFAWYDERRLYNYNNPGFSGATGHFTAVRKSM
jgi:uncharacterized protein YkwD